MTRRWKVLCLTLRLSTMAVNTQRERRLQTLPKQYVQNDNIGAIITVCIFRSPVVQMRRKTMLTFPLCRLQDEEIQIRVRRRQKNGQLTSRPWDFIRPSLLVEAAVFLVIFVHWLRCTKGSFQQANKLFINKNSWSLEAKQGRAIFLSTNPQMWDWNQNSLTLVLCVPGLGET